MKKYLFIGGPCDGDRMEASGMLHKTVYVPRGFDVRTVNACQPVGDHYTYVMKSVRVGITEVEVYVAGKLTDIEVLTLLLITYHGRK